MITNKFKQGDRVKLVRRHPFQGMCGLKDNMLGAKGVVEGPDLREAGAQEAWLIVRFRHPISLRLFSPTVAECMLDRDEGDGRVVIIPAGVK